MGQSCEASAVPWGLAMDPAQAQVASQYAGACFGIVCGVAAFFLPWRFNPFRPKGLLAAALSEKAARRLPRLVAIPVVLVSLLVLALTPVLGPMPW